LLALAENQLLAGELDGGCDRDRLRQATRTLLAEQNEHGGWGAAPHGETDPATTAWALAALDVASELQLALPPTAPRRATSRARAWLVSALNGARDAGATLYASSWLGVDPTATTQAAAFDVARQALASADWLALCQASCGLQRAGGAVTRPWRELLDQHASQLAGDHHGAATALIVIALQAPYRI
jgi:uncharacterized protein YfaS (alpha-2-macroglobulin family)